MRDYAKGCVHHENKFLFIDLPGFGYMVGHPDSNGPQTVEAIEQVIRHVAEQARRDAQLSERRRAARIVSNLGICHEAYSRDPLPFKAMCLKAQEMILKNPRTKSKGGRG